VEADAGYSAWNFGTWKSIFGEESSEKDYQEIA
jgi:hypothetical protein